MRSKFLSLLILALARGDDNDDKEALAWLESKLPKMDDEVPWTDDASHPRRIEKPAEDYIEKSVNMADTFANLVGGFDGAVGLASFLHDEIEEALGNASPEQKQKKKEREEKYKRILPLFEDSAETEEPPEEIRIDLSGDYKIHTAKDFFSDAWGKFREYMKTRPTVRVFDDEL